MSWKRVKKGVSALLAVLGDARRVSRPAVQKKFDVFSGLILSRPLGTNCVIRPFYFYST